MIRKPITLYLAVFMDSVVCMSDTKKYVKEYMKMRGVLKDSYNIEEVEVPYDDFIVITENPSYLNYVFGRLSTDYDYIVICDEFSDYVYELLQTNKCLDTMIHNLPKTVKDISSIQETQEIVEDQLEILWRMDKHSSAIFKDFYLNNDLWHRSIIPYMGYSRRRYEDTKENHERYLLARDKED